MYIMKNSYTLESRNNKVYTRPKKQVGYFLLGDGRDLSGRLPN